MRQAGPVTMRGANRDRGQEDALRQYAPGGKQTVFTGVAMLRFFNV